MKIYTYHDDLGRSHELELIELWKKSWSNHGYDPICLNRSHAESHPFFQQFDTQLRKVCYDIIGAPISDYGMSCWHRWLAYATQPNEKFYVSDYDAINVNFPITEPRDKLHLMDFACPFFASGTPIQFENLCKTFVEVSEKRIEALKSQANYYHDQEFFQYNFMPNNKNYENYRNQYSILMTRNRLEIGGGYNPITHKVLAGQRIGELTTENYKVIHVSHQNCQFILDKYPDLKKNHSTADLRIQIIKDALNMK